MKKIYLVPILVSIVIGCIAGFIYIKMTTESEVDVARQYDLVPLECDLMKKKCSKDFNGQTITFDMSPRPVEIMAETTISIEGLNYDFYDAKIRIYGLNMDMGTIIASLEKDGNSYKTEVALSACLVEDIMRYRIAVYDGNEPTDLYIDFDVPR